MGHMLTSIMRDFAKLTGSALPPDKPPEVAVIRIGADLVIHVEEDPPSGCIYMSAVLAVPFLPELSETSQSGRTETQLVTNDLDQGWVWKVTADGEATGLLIESWADSSTLTAPAFHAWVTEFQKIAESFCKH